MPREIYTPKGDSQGEIKEKLETENELLKGCVMELAEALFAE